MHECNVIHTLLGDFRLKQLVGGCLLLAGLYHTFSEDPYGCREPNDFVDDTAQEASPQRGCPNPAPNSCYNKPFSQPLLEVIREPIKRLA